MNDDDRKKKADIVERLKDKKSENPVSLAEFCWLLRQNGLSHNHGYFHYTTWDRLRSMLEKHDVGTCEQHRLFFLSAASQMNDQNDAHDGTYIASFSFGEEEEIAMWTNYGVPKRGAVRIRFPMAAITKWSNANVPGKMKVYVQANGNTSFHLLEVRPVSVEFADVAYFGRNDENDKAKHQRVRYRGMSFGLKDDKWRKRIKGKPEAVLFKKRGWAYENEVRLIVRFADTSAVKKYAKIALDFDSLYDAMLADVEKNVLLGPWQDKYGLQLPAIAGIAGAGHSTFEGELRMRSNCDLCGFKESDDCKCPNAEWRMWERKKHWCAKLSWAELEN